MPSRDLVYPLDILEAARLVQIFVKDVDQEMFEQDLLRQSEEFRANHPTIPWRSIAGMRDILIHAYDHVDLDEVWSAATVAIPQLIHQIEPLLPPPGERK